MSGIRRLLPAAFLVAYILLPSLVFGDALRVVALTGQEAPGAPASVVFDTLGAAQINSKGQAAFTSTLAGPGVDEFNGGGVWSERLGNLHLVTRLADELQIPGLPSPMRLRRFDGLWLNDAGRVLVRGSDVNNVLTNRYSYWADDNGSMRYVTHAPSPAPGTPAGVNFDEYLGVVFNRAGQAVFRASLTGSGVNTGNDSGYWFHDGSAATLVAREGDAVPGVSNRLFLQTSSSPVLNDAGRYAFVASTRPTGAGSNQIHLWTNRGGSLAAVASIADGSLLSPEINSAGKIAFRKRDSSFSPERWSILSDGQSGFFATIATTNQAAPGAGAGVTFNSFSDLLLNDAGHVVFSADLRGASVNVTNDRGIWLKRSGGLELVVREGDIVATSQFGSPRYLKGTAGLPGLSLNARGQVAMYAKLVDDRTSSFEVGDALFVYDLDGALKTIAQTGMEIDVDDGPGLDLRRISAITNMAATGNGDGRPSMFNDLGQLVFRVAFTDGSSAVLVSNLVAIPEPSAWLLSLLGASVIGPGVRRSGQRRRDSGNYVCH